MKRECSNCKEVKNLNEYHKAPLSKDGKNAQCKECINTKNRIRYHKNDDELKRRRKNSKDRVKANREFVYKYLETHPCVDCGENNPIVLEFDHKNGEDKVGNVCNIVFRQSMSRLKDEIEKCEVRCANCHRIKTSKEFEHYRYLKYTK